MPRGGSVDANLGRLDGKAVPLGAADAAGSGTRSSSPSGVLLSRTRHPVLATPDLPAEGLNGVAVAADTLRRYTDL